MHSSIPKRKETKKSNYTNKCVCEWQWNLTLCILCEAVSISHFSFAVSLKQKRSMSTMWFETPHCSWHIACRNEMPWGSIKPVDICARQFHPKAKSEGLSRPEKGHNLVVSGFLPEDSSSWAPQEEEGYRCLFVFTCRTAVHAQSNRMQALRIILHANRCSRNSIHNASRHNLA